MNIWVFGFLRVSRPINPRKYEWKFEKKKKKKRKGLLIAVDIPKKKGFTLPS